MIDTTPTGRKKVKLLQKRVLQLLQTGFMYH